MNTNQNQWVERYLANMDEEGYVPFNADRRLGQNQYASRFASGKQDSLNLGQGLRWKNLESGSYHDLMIHNEDLVEFHRRVKAAKDDIGMGINHNESHYVR